MRPFRSAGFRAVPIDQVNRPRGNCTQRACCGIGEDGGQSPSRRSAARVSTPPPPPVLAPFSAPRARPSAVRLYTPRPADGTMLTFTSTRGCVAARRAQKDLAHVASASKRPARLAAAAGGTSACGSPAVAVPGDPAWAHPTPPMSNYASQTPSHRNAQACPQGPRSPARGWLQGSVGTAGRPAAPQR